MGDNHPENEGSADPMEAFLHNADAEATPPPDAADELAQEIREIGERLTEIVERRDQLPEDAFAEKADLRDEELELRSRLATLTEHTGMAPPSPPQDETPASGPGEDA